MPFASLPAPLAVFRAAVSPGSSGCRTAGTGGGGPAVVSVKAPSDRSQSERATRALSAPMAKSFSNVSARAGPAALN